MKKYPKILRVLFFLCSFLSLSCMNYIHASNTYEEVGFEVAAKRKSTGEEKTIVISNKEGGLLNSLKTQIKALYSDDLQDSYGYELDASSIYFLKKDEDGKEKLIYEKTGMRGYVQLITKNHNSIEYDFIIAHNQKNLALAKEKGHKTIEKHLQAILDNPTNLQEQHMHRLNLATAYANTLLPDLNDSNTNPNPPMPTRPADGQGSANPSKPDKTKDNHSFRNMFIITSAVIIGIGAILFTITGSKTPRTKHKRKD